MQAETDKFDQLQNLLGEISPEEASARVAKLDAEIQELEGQIDVRRKERATLRSSFDLKIRRGDPKTASPGNGTVRSKPADVNRVDEPREDFHPNVGALRYGVLDYVASFDGKPVKLSEISREMIEQGLAPDDENGKKRVGVTAARLTKSGQIERGEMTGYYQLPAHGHTHESRGDGHELEAPRDLASTEASSDDH